MRLPRLSPLVCALVCALALCCARPALAQSSPPPGRAWPPTDALPELRAVAEGAAEDGARTAQEPPVSDCTLSPVAFQPCWWMQTWTRTVFQSARDGNWELYRTRGDGSEPLRLTWTAAAEVRPRISPNGTRIAYDLDADGDGTREIWLMDWDGSSPRTVVESAGSDYAPAWSPDGARLAFVSTRGGSADVYEIELSTGAQRVVAATPLADFDPAYNRATGELLWVRQLDGATGAIMGLLDGVERAVVGERVTPQRIVVDPAGNAMAFNADPDRNGWLDVEEIFFFQPWNNYVMLALIQESQGLIVVTEPYMNAYGPWFGDYGGGVQYTLATWERPRRQPFRLTNLRIVWSSYLGYIDSYPWTVAASGWDAFGDWTNLDHTPPTATVETPGSTAVLVEGGPPPRLVADDGGGSGVSWYEAEWLQGGEVRTWSNNYLMQPFLDFCDPGWVRLRARDAAGLWSPWTPKVPYLLVMSRIGGQVTDVRGVGLPEIPITGTIYTGQGAVTTDAQGRFTAFNCASNPEVRPQPPAAFMTPSSLRGDEHRRMFPPVMLLPTRGRLLEEPFDYADETAFDAAWAHGPDAGVVEYDFGPIPGSGFNRMLYLGALWNGEAPAETRLWASRRVPVPAPAEDQHELTLTFHVAAEPRAARTTVPLTISVQTSAWPTVTIVYTEALPSMDWEARRAPVPLPVGAALTVTVESYTRLDRALPTILLDNLVLASWWTPHVTGIAVDAPDSGAELGTQTVITLTGENFVTPLAVDVGGLAGTVEQVDAGTLRVTFEEPLPSGLHPVRVTNLAGTPGAVTSHAPQSVLTGRAVWLPAVNGP